MAKTYIPTLVRVARALTKYIGRWYDVLAENLTTEQATALDQCLACTNSLLALIPSDLED